MLLTRSDAADCARTIHSDIIGNECSACLKCSASDREHVRHDRHASNQRLSGLERFPDNPHLSGVSVSVVIVAYESTSWKAATLPPRRPGRPGSSRPDCGPKQ